MFKIVMVTILFFLNSAFAMEDAKKIDSNETVFKIDFENFYNKSKKNHVVENVFSKISKNVTEIEIMCDCKYIIAKDKIEEFFIEISKFENLEKLSFLKSSNGKTSSENIVNLAFCFSQKLNNKFFQKLTSLNIELNEVKNKDEQLIDLFKNLSLQNLKNLKFDLSRNKINEDMMTAFGQVFNSLKCLESLDIKFDGCEFDFASMKKFSSKLETLQTLKSLDLRFSSSHLEDEVMENFLMVLDSLINLENINLNFEYNKINKDNAKILSKKLGSLKKLKTMKLCLSLSLREDVDKIDFFTKLLGSEALELVDFDLKHCSIVNQSVEAIFQKLNSMQTLRKVKFNFDYNLISGFLIKKLMQGLQNSTICNLEIVLNKKYIDAYNLAEIVLDVQKKVNYIFSKNNDSEIMYKINDIVVKPSNDDSSDNYFLESNDQKQSNAKKASKIMSNYTINLMWINKNKEYSICSKLNDFKENIINWAVKNPKGRVVFWYDSEFVRDSDTAAVSAKKVIDDALGLMGRNDLKEKIIFKNIRDLEYWKDKEDKVKMLNTIHSVYYRVDLLRSVAAYDEVNNTSTTCFVYADLDMASLSEKELFDEETLSDLCHYGIVMARGGHLGFENGFQMISYHEKFMSVLEKFIIDLNFFRTDRYDEENNKIGFQVQAVYDSYPVLFLQLFATIGFGKVILYNQELPVDEKLLFKNLCIDDLRSRVTFDANSLKIGDYARAYENFVPTKIVPLPPTRF